MNTTVTFTGNSTGGAASRRGDRRWYAVLGLATLLLLSSLGVRRLESSFPAWTGPSDSLVDVSGSDSTPRVPVGANFHGMWSSYTDSQRIAVLDSLRWAGATSVRIDLSWAMLQPTSAAGYDAWGVGFADRVIAMANDRGLTPLIMLWMTPGWANDDSGERALPDDPADYARVARFAATRWRGQVAGWEVWNEPNSAGYMTGADPAAYVRLLRAAYPALKAGDPAAPVITGGVEYNDTDWLTRMYDAGARGYFDAVATHPYMGIADADPAVVDDGTKWTFTHAAAVHQLMVSRGDGYKKLWFTEFGWSSHGTAAGAPNWLRGVTESVQSTYLAKAADLVDSTMPYVQAMYWYADLDESTGNIQYDNYGLFHENFAAKPVFTGMRTTNELSWPADAVETSVEGSPRPWPTRSSTATGSRPPTWG